MRGKDGVVGPHALLPDMVPAAGVQPRQPSEEDQRGVRDQAHGGSDEEAAEHYEKVCLLFDNYFENV